MATTYTPIKSITLAADTATISFTDIPQLYTDLVIRATHRGTLNALEWDGNISANDVSSGISYTRLTGDGSSIGSFRLTNNSFGDIYVMGTQTAANTFNSTELYFASYAGSAYKTISGFSANENNSDITMVISSGLQQSSSPITKITLGTFFATGSTFHLYGIKNS